MTAAHLSEDQLQTLRRQLEAEWKRLTGKTPLETVEALLEPRDQQEFAAEEVQRRDELALSDHDRARLREVEAALARMAQRTYGWCEETGEPIPFARLQAEPTTRYSVEAMELLEEERARERVVGVNDSDELY